MPKDVTNPAEPSPTPTPPPAPPPGGAPQGRAGHGLRDMALSMGALAVLILVLALLTHSCSFDPGRPDTSGVTVPTVDVHGELQAAASQVRFPLREPKPPSGWRANSDSVTPLGADSQYADVRVGWLTPDARYLSVAQSNADVTDLVRAETNSGDGAVTAQGSTTVAGVTWTIYPGVRTEQVWVTEVDGTRLLITGDGSTGEFDTMAKAVQQGAKVAPAAP